MTESVVGAPGGGQRENAISKRLSCRKSAFTRIKERNAERLLDAMRSPQLRVTFNSIPVEITENRVILDGNGTTEELGNNFV